MQRSEAIGLWLRSFFFVTLSFPETYPFLLDFGKNNTKWNIFYEMYGLC